MFYADDNTIINLDNVVTINKHTKYAKGDDYSEGPQYLIGVSTIQREWDTVYRSFDQNDRDKKFDEMRSCLFTQAGVDDKKSANYVKRAYANIALDPMYGPIPGTPDPEIQPNHY